MKVDAYGNYREQGCGWKGSGGGVSLYEPKPAYQQFVTFSSPKRSGPDVAYQRRPRHGFYVYHSHYRSTVEPAPGGRWAAPAAARAVGGPDRHRQSGPRPGQPGLARWGQPDAAGPLQDGQQQLPRRGQRLNGKSAGIGFDLVTGRGSPYADRIIRDLVAYNVRSGVFTATSVKVVGPGPNFTPASMFMTLVEGPNGGDPAENPQATVDWNKSFLRRTEYALAEYAPLNRLKN